jgi:uncharacterized membrane-anchored protein YitT (DUF2179 family)
MSKPPILTRFTSNVFSFLMKGRKYFIVIYIDKSQPRSESDTRDTDMNLSVTSVSFETGYYLRLSGV